jgi:hypothetical protein
MQTGDRFALKAPQFNDFSKLTLNAHKNVGKTKASLRHCVTFGAVNKEQGGGIVPPLSGLREADR